MANEHPDSIPAIKVSMMPRDTNVHDTIFGGVLLSHIDQAGAVHARKAGGCARVVTVAMDEIVFDLPVFVGDVVSYHCETLKIGRTSIRVRVEVWADRFRYPNEDVRVTVAEVTYVNIGQDREPIPIPRP